MNGQFHDGEIALADDLIEDVGPDLVELVRLVVLCDVREAAVVRFVHGEFTMLVMASVIISISFGRSMRSFGLSFDEKYQIYIYYGKMQIKVRKTNF